VSVEYATPSSALDIVAGPDEALWFTEWKTHRIGRMSTGGMVTEYPIPCCGAPEGITLGPDGALWFAETTNKIGRITTARVVTAYSLPASGASASGIAVGPDGALWFTEQLPSAPGTNGLPYVNRIGRITTSGVITEYVLPPSTGGFQGAYSIATGSDGAMWF